MHCAEVKADREFFASVAHKPMSYCDSVGLPSPNTVLVHLDESDIAPPRMRSVSARSLGSFIIGLGTDGAPCNNTYDLLQEMKLAAIIHKSLSYDPTAVPAESVLEMATINGAKALGLDDRIGSLKIGKKADFVAIDMRGIQFQPWFNATSAVVYTATGRGVEVVVVDGKMLVEKGELITIEEAVVEQAGLTQQMNGRWI